MDPRTPVIIGVGQLANRVDRGATPLEPVDMIAEAASRALADAGPADRIRTAIDSVRTISMLSWRYRNPGHHVAKRLGARTDIDTTVSAMGGNSPQSLVNTTAADILAGRCELAVLGGAEAWRTRKSYTNRGERPPWTVEADDLAPARQIGSPVDMNCDAELRVGIGAPVQIYPMFEQAHRHRLGRDMDEHLAEVGALWSGFADVASRNPHAWIQTGMTAEQIITPTESNRLIGYPYTKVMNSNSSVEQAAAIILCSAERAEQLGVPRDRWVFAVAGADARDHKYVSNRADLVSAPAVGVTSRRMFEAAGSSVHDVSHVDLYSCFPIAPQIGAQELGLDPGVQLTLTGGLAFAGGPWNNYVMHAIAALVGTLRDDPGSHGLIWGNGGYFTKHAFGVYSTEPPARGWVHVAPQDEIDSLDSVDVSTDHEGDAAVESWTVMHGTDGTPETGLFALRLADGRRAWGSNDDAQVVPHLLDGELIGTGVHRTAEGTVKL